MWQVHEYFHTWQRQRYKDGLPYAGYEAMCLRVTELKRTTHRHWNALPSQAIQEELKRIHLAYERFFQKLGGRPKIKKRHKFKSFTLKQAGWSLKDNRITLTLRKWNPKTRKWQYDKVAYTFHKHREFEGNIRRLTIKRGACGDYWLYLITDFVETKPLPTTGQSVGADFGMKTFLTLSDGTRITSPEFYKQGLNAIRSANKALSRKQKGSHAWYRAKRHLARVHKKITNQRRDWFFKLALRLVRKYDTIAIETLNLEGMKKLWGRKISDVAFGEFSFILQWTFAKHGKTFLKAGRWKTTTKPCSTCGYCNENLSLSDRQWTCPECGSHHDRDINAARNILQAGVPA